MQQSLARTLSRQRNSRVASRLRTRLSPSGARSAYPQCIQNGRRYLYPNPRPFSTRQEPVKATIVDESSISSSIEPNDGPLHERGNDDFLGYETHLFEGLTSRPKKGGNWNPRDPVGWSRHFGRRCPEYEEHLKSLINLKEGDEGFFDNSEMKLPKVTIVRTKDQAKIVMKKLMNADRSILHACDTEVMDIDLSTVGPVGNGYVTCASIYSGPDFDYGLGEEPGSTLWIDNLDDACGILMEFKEWFEDPTIEKLQHEQQQ